MIITNKKDSKQRITINSWSDKKYNIVFTNGLQALTTYLKASKPSNSQINAASQLVWKKCGLAQA